MVGRTVTKEEAVRAQVSTAIELHFQDFDPISVHVLASSALVILRDLASQTGKQSLHDRLLPLIKPDRQTEFLRLMKQAYNYFKHADRDAEVELDNFSDDINDQILLMCCHDHGAVFGKSPVVQSVFFGWYISAYPDTISDDQEVVGLAQGYFGEDMADLSRDDQKNLGLQALRDAQQFHEDGLINAHWK